MASFEFKCPHCNGRFVLEHPPAGGQVACPTCHQTLAIPAEFFRSPDATDADDKAGALAPPDEPELLAPELDFDVDEPSLSTSPAWRTGEEPQSAVKEPAEPVVITLSREAVERRRQIRSLAWMIGGVVLLAIAAMILSRL